MSDAVLIIDPDGKLALAVTFQGFQPVRVERSEVGKRCRSIQNSQALFSLPAKSLPIPNGLASGDLFRGPVAVSLYHSQARTIVDVRRHTYNVAATCGLIVVRQRCTH